MRLIVNVFECCTVAVFVHYLLNSQFTGGFVFTVTFYSAAAIALLASLVADRGKTGEALRKALRAFTGIFPEFIGVIVTTGVIIAFLDQEAISRIIGGQSGWAGVAGAALVGSVALIPGFVAFPLAALLLEQGAGLFQIGAFVSSLMMVGVVTFPLERTVFGTRVALVRNLLAFFFSVAVAGILAVALGSSV